MDELREGAREGATGREPVPITAPTTPAPFSRPGYLRPSSPRPLPSLGPSASSWETPSLSRVSSGSGQEARCGPEKPGGQSPPPQSPAPKPRLGGPAIRTPRPALPTGLETRARLASTCRRPPGRPWAHRRAHAARTHRPRASLPAPEPDAQRAQSIRPPEAGRRRAARGGGVGWGG